MAKSCYEDLAIFGGAPAFDSPLHVNLPNVGKRETFDSYVDEIWGRRWFTNNGPLATELEHVLQHFLGIRQCALTSSGTSALAVLAKALGLGGEVIVPSLMFVSTAHVLHWSGSLAQSSTGHFPNRALTGSDQPFLLPLMQSAFLMNSGNERVDVISQPSSLVAGPT